MGRQDLSEAIKEAYATAKSDVVYWDTIEVSHPSVILPMYLICDRVGRLLRLETGDDAYFTPSGFRFVLPAVGDNGVQELSLQIDNVDRKPSDFVQSVLESSAPVQITYRPYLSTSPSDAGPEMNPPLILFLTDVVITGVDITGRATFADILNKNFLSLQYSRRNFPGL